jgi:excisionase family DNA binding protein
MMAPGGSNKLIGTRELAERLNVSHYQLRHKWRDWELPAIWVGGLLKFRERDIEAWLTEREVKHGG